MLFGHGHLWQSPMTGGYPIPGVCADINHSKTGVRVQSGDLTTFKLYYGKTDTITKCCDTAAPAGDCILVAGDPYNFWTN